jgi:hypothetical protein
MADKDEGDERRYVEGLEGQSIETHGGHSPHVSFFDIAPARVYSDRISCQWGEGERWGE